MPASVPWRLAILSRTWHSVRLAGWSRATIVSPPEVNLMKRYAWDLPIRSPGCHLDSNRSSSAATRKPTQSCVSATACFRRSVTFAAALARSFVSKYPLCTCHFASFMLIIPTRVGTNWSRGVYCSSSKRRASFASALAAHSDNS